jgi:hypothetical protein
MNGHQTPETMTISVIPGLPNPLLSRKSVAGHLPAPALNAVQPGSVQQEENLSRYAASCVTAVQLLLQAQHYQLPPEADPAAGLPTAYKRAGLQPAAQEAPSQSRPPHTHCFWLRSCRRPPTLYGMQAPPQLRLVPRTDHLCLQLTHAHRCFEINRCQQLSQAKRHTRKDRQNLVKVTG